MDIEGRAFAVVGILAVVFAVQVLSNDVKTLYTNGDDYSQYFSLKENMDEEKTVRFSVRAMKEVSIVLAPGHQAKTPVYEIVLGARDNTLNFIRGRCPCQEEPSATIETVNLLSRKEFRKFWVRIKSDTRRAFVQVGLAGSEIPFHEWRDPRPLTPLFLSFKSSTTAEWRYGFSDDTYTTGLSKDKRQAVVTAAGFGQYYPLSEIASHSDDAVSLYFTLKTTREFQILLSPSVSPLGDIYEFGIRDSGAYIRRRHLGENKAVFKQDNFLETQDRVRYWIRLTKGGNVAFGKAGSVDPFVEWQDQNPVAPQFVSFTLHRERRDTDLGFSADIEFGLGADYTLASQDCRPRWKDTSTQIPPGAVRGGYDINNELFVCRAKHGKDTFPGSLMRGKDRRDECHVTSLFFVYRKKEFQVLTGCRFTWVPASGGKIPDGAITTGKTSQNDKLYVSRVAIDNQVIIGKLSTIYRLTFVPFESQELPFTKYEVLVNTANRAAATNNGQSNNVIPVIG